MTVDNSHPSENEELQTKPGASSAGFQLVGFLDKKTFKHESTPELHYGRTRVFALTWVVLVGVGVVCLLGFIAFIR